MKLENSTWMFQADSATFYADRFDFIRFNTKGEIEYLDGKGAFLRNDRLLSAESGNYQIKGSPFFKGIEFVNPTEINFVYETEYTSENGYRGKRDMRLNFTKLVPTIIEVSKEALTKIQADSEWALIHPNGKSNNLMKFTSWQEIPAEEIEKTTQDPHEYSKYQMLQHLTKIEDSLIAVQAKLGLVYSKAMVSKLTDTEMMLVNPFKGKENFVFKRVS